jgi:outer membrane protease
MKQPRLALTLACSLILCTASFLGAEESPAALAFRTFSTVQYGDIHELVTYKGETLSELIWDIKPIVSFGLGSSYIWKKELLFDFSFSVGIPGNSGEMTDSDWLNILSDGSTYKTTFSKHEARLDYYFNSRIFFGRKISINNIKQQTVQQSSITPIIGLNFISWKWSGQNGYLQHTTPIGTAPNGEDIYPAWDESVTKVPVYGTCITYQQTYLIPEIGIHMVIPVTEHFNIESSVTMSFLTFCRGIDTHYIGTDYGTYVDYRNASSYKEYTDILSWGFYYAPSILLRWNMKDKNSLYISCQYMDISSLEGSSYLRNSGSSTSTLLGSLGGASGSSLNLTCGMEIPIR